MFYYFVGIKGSGMSALAKILIDKGHIVLGVDFKENYYTEKNLYNVKIEDFDNYVLKKEYIYIIGNAFRGNNISKRIIKSGYRYYYYAEFIDRFFKDYKFIAVSGSHGKTTTTKMLSHILHNSSYLIGDGTGSGIGKENFIIEACEYRNTFLNYNPDYTIILNVDYDHPDFFETKDSYNLAFLNLINKSRLAIINGDDPFLKTIKRDNILRFGTNEDNNIVFKYKFQNNKTIVNIFDKEFVLPILGFQYAYDFVGAYIIARLLSEGNKSISKNIAKFTLPKRRMYEKIIDDKIMIHDYAHHPTEINAVYESIKLKYPNNKKICVFQPHTYSRSLKFKEEFKISLDNFDYCYILPIFSSVREEKSQKLELDLYNYWGKEVIHDVELLNIKNNIIYVFLGAGDIDKIYNVVVKRYENKKNKNSSL